jgi:hypothetical protein
MTRTRTQSARPPSPVPSFVRRARAFARVAGALAVMGAVGAASAGGCGSENGVVGGDCASAYTQCDLACFNLQTDPNHCGSCDNVCPAGEPCVGGKCQGSLDGNTLDDGSLGEIVDGEIILPDGEIEYCDVIDPEHPVCHPRPVKDANGSDDGSSTDGTLGDGNNGGGDGSSSGGGDGSSSGGGDGSSSGGDGSSSGGGDGCAPPYDTAANCGSCGHVCVAPNDVCALEDGGFQCAPLCSAPLTDCSGACVNLARDPKNCGTCGHVCTSQYCFLATCQGSVAGNIMMIGHDFQKTAPSDEQAILLTNSVFYNPGAVNLLSFEHYADPATVANGLAILTSYASAQHITLNIQSTSDDTSISNDTLLASASAVLFWDQSAAPTGKLGTLGTTWAPHLTTFVQGGGIVIGLDGDQGTGEMPIFMTNAALLAVTAHGQVSAGSPADVPLAGLSIARGMTNVYAVEQNTAWFTTSEASGAKTLYVANVQGQPTQLLAVQKVIN